MLLRLSVRYTDVHPDVSTDLYVNPFRWLGPSMDPVVVVIDDTDNDPAGGIRIADLDFYTPMFDCFAVARGFFKCALSFTRAGSTTASQLKSSTG